MGQASERVLSRLECALVPGISGIACLIGLGSQLYRWGIGGIPFPFEDAAMLFRYAEVLAQGGGLAWNHGDSPGASDGATDLGFVLLLAPLILLGLKPATAGFLLNIVGLFGVGLLIGHVARQKLSSPWWIPVLVSFGVGLTVASPIAGGFSSPVMAFLLLLVLTAALNQLMHGNAEASNASTWIVLGGLAALCGWWRPEGFALGPVVAALTVVSFLLSNGEKTSIRSWGRGLKIAFAAYALSVGLWIGFRISYFGHPLQTSGVNKITQPNLVSATDALYFYAMTLSWLLIPLLVFLLIAQKFHPVLVLIFIFAMSSIFWLPFALTFNWWGRIYWPLVPVLAILALLPILASDRSSFARVKGEPKKSALVVLLIMLLLVPNMPQPWGRYAPSPFHTNMYQALRPLETENVRLATTEAGLIPLAIKRGRALDTYIHNTRSIAENGDPALRQELVSFDPNLIVVHGPPPFMLDPQSQCLEYYGQEWFVQTQTLYEYAKGKNMELVRSEVAGPCDTWNVFSDESLPRTIVSAVESLPPLWS